MRLSLLLKREPLPVILEQTLTGFLSRWQGRHQKVRWYPGRPCLAAINRRGEQPWLCNFYLNAIFAPEVDPLALEPLVREFSRSTKWWRRPLQELYVKLAFSGKTSSLLAQAALGIAPPLPESAKLVIIAGNQKLRLLDRGGGEIHVMLKSGFPTNFMERELAVRQLAAGLGLPVPPLKTIAADGTWFTEAYVQGTPLNRLGAPDQVRRAVSEVAHHLRTLVEHTMKEESLSHYLAQLEDQVNAYLIASRLLTESQVRTWRQMTEALIGRLRRNGAKSRSKIYLSMTHGDLQPANILVNGTAIWFIDWEYASQRQLAYDSLVFLGRSRSPKGLARRLQELTEKGPASGEVNLSWRKDDWAETGSRRFFVDLFLLEELTLKLQENANRRFLQVGEGLQILGTETARWLRATG